VGKALRRVAVFVYVIAFILSIVGVSLNPENAWQLLSSGDKVLLGFNVLVGFCGVLLAYFVYIDGEELGALRATVHGHHNETSKLFENLVPASTELSIPYVKLVNRYKQEGFLNPELKLESEINEKMVNGKTREEAISELYSENTSKNEV
jgi:hypothetical protein